MRVYYLTLRDGVTKISYSRRRVRPSWAARYGNLIPVPIERLNEPAFVSDRLLGARLFEVACRVCSRRELGMLRRWLAGTKQKQLSEYWGRCGSHQGSAAPRALFTILQKIRRAAADDPEVQRLEEVL